MGLTLRSIQSSVPLMRVAVLAAMAACHGLPDAADGVSQEMAAAAVVSSHEDRHGASDTGDTAALMEEVHVALPRPPGRFAPAYTEAAIMDPATGKPVPHLDLPQHRQTPTQAGPASLGRRLADVDGCADCHADIAAAWRTSAHAWASLSNPSYRESLQRFAADAGTQAMKFCGGCHDPALLVDEVLTEAFAESPTASHDVANHTAGGIADSMGGSMVDDARAHAGVSCAVCHGMSDAAVDGNGSYTLRAARIPVPMDDDPGSLARHRRAVRPRAGAALCTGCHRSFLGPELSEASFARSGSQLGLSDGPQLRQQLRGMDDVGAWRDSIYGSGGIGQIDDEIAAQDCVDCHMAPEPAVLGDVAAGADGRVAGHRFLGGHTWLAAMRDDGAMAEMQRRFLRGAATIDIAAAVDLAPGQDYRALPADGAELRPVMGLDVVVRNQRVGHRFPGGIGDAQDTWIEVEVRDRAGRLWAASGLAHGNADPATADDDVHILRTLMADRDGRLLLGREVHDFAAVVGNHTIGPRQVAVIRYRLDWAALGWASPDRQVPEGPFIVRARLRHRSRNRTVQAAACAAARTAEGRRFARAAQAFHGAKLDPCAPQPITDIAEAQVWIGGNAATVSGKRPAWRRLYEHGMGWLGATQERVDQARPSLLAALSLLEDIANSNTNTQIDRYRAMVLTSLGKLAAR